MSLAEEMNSHNEMMNTDSMLRDCMKHLVAGRETEIYTTRLDYMIDEVLDRTTWLLIDVRVRWYCIRQRQSIKSKDSGSCVLKYPPLVEAWKICLYPFPKGRHHAHRILLS